MTCQSKFQYKQHRRFLKCRDVRHNKILIVPCELINKRFEEYHIQTTHYEIMDIFTLIDNQRDKMNASNRWIKANNEKHTYTRKDVNQHQKDKMNRIYKNIERYSEFELNDIFEKNSNEWIDWCNDCILYYCFNKKLNNVTIPIMESDNGFYDKALYSLKNSRKFK